jgi:hypothetical protein
MHLKQRSFKISRLASLRVGSGALPARSRTLTASFGGGVAPGASATVQEVEEWDASFKLPEQVGLHMGCG